MFFATVLIVYFTEQIINVPPTVSPAVAEGLITGNPRPEQKINVPPTVSLAVAEV